MLLIFTPGISRETNCKHSTGNSMSSEWNRRYAIPKGLDAKKVAFAKHLWSLNYVMIKNINIH